MPDRKHLIMALLLLAPAIVIGTAFMFAPKAETPRDEALPEGDWVALATGNVKHGDSDHRASGNVTLYGNGTHHFLRFEAYDAKAGPDVWFYLVEDSGADSADAVEEDGLRLRVPGPGQATYRGHFNVPLAEGTDPDPYGALVAWCKRFNTRYAVALLEPVGGPNGQD